MNAPPPSDPRELTDDLARAIAGELGPGAEASNPLLLNLLKEIKADAGAFAERAEKMGGDLDQLEDLLEALALTAGTARTG